MQQSEMKEKEVFNLGGFDVLFALLAFLIVYAVVAYNFPMLMAMFPVVVIAIVFIFAGMVIIKPNEAAVYTFFGKYVGSLKKEGFFFVNPLAKDVSPIFSKTSLKTMTLQNGKQKINDELGNPIEVGIVVIWRIVDTAKAVFGVENYCEYLSIQTDSCLRNIISIYPYDAAADKKSLRGSSDEISQKLQEEIQKKAKIAGIEILEAKITHLAYAPEIALAMLQRQQAVAVIEARKLIVEGAVSMVDMALKEIGKNKMVELDDGMKAHMITNLMLVLCSNKDAQPVINASNGCE